jgi:hypothetical protein
MEKYNALTNEMPSLGKVYENPENLKAIKQKYAFDQTWYIVRP